MAIKVGGTTVIDDSLRLTNISDLTASGSVNVSNLTTTGNVEFSGTGAIKIPSGTTEEQPTGLSAGYLRFNTERNKPEIFDGNKFGALGGDGGGVVDYIVADSTAPRYIVKQLEIVEDNFTLIDTWQLEDNEENSAVLHVLDVPSIDETGEYFEETTTINTHHAFFDTLNVFAESTITIAPTKILQGFGGIGTSGVSAAPGVVDKMQSIGKIFYLNSIIT